MVGIDSLGQTYEALHIKIPKFIAALPMSDWERVAFKLKEPNSWGSDCYLSAGTLRKIKGYQHLRGD
jgi:hypothetical protein